jgi:PTH1 family peptidyl-tRNA hydrolase
MKLVVGLGNPGAKYRGTRHNIGFEIVAEVARRHSAGSKAMKFRGEVCDCAVNGIKTLLLMPLTYMNASGGSVRAAVNFYKLSTSDVLVVCDDLHLPLGRIRFRAKGSAGGQKGLDDILKNLGTEDVARLRFGIGIPPAGRDAVDFVLGKFSSGERGEIDVAIAIAADGVADWISSGIEYCMNRYNGR